MKITGEAPLLSVIVAVRDGARFLAEAIQSILVQGYEPIEIIVVDDGSTDGSDEVAAAFGPPVQVVRQPPLGVADALNNGAAIAVGSLLAFIDADDLWCEGKLARQLAVLENRPDVDIVFGHAEHFAGDDPTVITIPSQPGYLKGSMVVRRAAYDRVDAFSSEWRLGDFIDWYARAVEEGLVSLMLPDVVLLRRVHDRNMGITRRGELTEYTRVLKAMLDRRRANTPFASKAQATLEPGRQPSEFSTETSGSGTRESATGSDTA